MPRFSANISTMFLEREPLERVRAAHDAGFEGIEVQFPYDFPGEDWVRAAEDAGVTIVGFNVSAGDLVDGGPGLAGVPGREALFREAVAKAKAYAAVLKPRIVNVLPGKLPPGATRKECLDVLAGNLAHAAAELGQAGATVTVEAINTRDLPGFLLSRSAEVLEIIERAGDANLALEHDLYHMQIMEGDLIPTLERIVGRIGHIQFADAPGRHEPGTGEIDFPAVFAAIDRLDYSGWVGAEYLPTGRTEDSLDWLRPYL